MSDQRPNFREYWGQYCPRCKHDGINIGDMPCYQCSPGNLEAVFSEMFEEYGNQVFMMLPPTEKLTAPTKFEYWEN